MKSVQHDGEKYSSLLKFQSSKKSSDQATLQCRKTHYLIIYMSEESIAGLDL